jgi:hypothetical protein
LTSVLLQVSVTACSVAVIMVGVLGIRRVSGRLFLELVVLAAVPFAASLLVGFSANQIAAQFAGGSPNRFVLLQLGVFGLAAVLLEFSRRRASALANVATVSRVKVYNIPTKLVVVTASAALVALRIMRAMPVDIAIESHFAVQEVWVWHYARYLPSAYIEQTVFTYWFHDRVTEVIGDRLAGTWVEHWSAVVAGAVTVLFFIAMHEVTMRNALYLGLNMALWIGLKHFVRSIHINAAHHFLSNVVVALRLRNILAGLG